MLFYIPARRLKWTGDGWAAAAPELQPWQTRSSQPESQAPRAAQAGRLRPGIVVCCTMSDFSRAVIR